jgi:hypothetical protein
MSYIIMLQRLNGGSVVAVIPLCALLYDLFILNHHSMDHCLADRSVQCKCVFYIV